MNIKENILHDMKTSSNMMKKKIIVYIFLQNVRQLERDFMQSKSTCHRFQTHNTICRDENEKKV